VALTAATSGTTVKPSITVAAGGNLTLAANTVIDLGGNGTAVGSIALTNNDPATKITFAGPGAKITTALASATATVTPPIGGTLVANSGSVGGGLEVHSTDASGSDLKLGYIVPAADATFDGIANVISGPTSTGPTIISGATTVTES
jgi:hypothetical protein